MGPLCAPWLLVLRLTSPDASVPPAPPPAPEPVHAPSVTPPPQPPTPEHATKPPSATRLALRDPFQAPNPALRYRPPASPDLIDPFARPAPSTRPTPSHDLRDPFVDGVRCTTQDGVPLQRPRRLEAKQPNGCAPIDRPLRNPFAPIETHAPRTESPPRKAP